MGASQSGPKKLTEDQILDKQGALKQKQAGAIRSRKNLIVKTQKLETECAKKLKGLKDQQVALTKEIQSLDTTYKETKIRFNSLKVDPTKQTPAQRPTTPPSRV